MSRHRTKVGRNDLCWCHSAKKYKHCHLEREQQPVKPPWEVASDIREQFRDSKYCLHALASTASCSGKIVRAHSLPRSTGLSAIAEKGHVYGPEYDFMALVKNNGAPQRKLIGINEASTFTGFCGLHDHGTFEPLENQPLTGSPHQCFLMGYRAVCRELFLKRLHLESVKVLREVDRGRSTWHQEQIQCVADLMEISTMLGSGEITYHKNLYDGLLTNARWGEYHGVVIEFGVTPEVLFTGAFFPVVNASLANVKALASLTMPGHLRQAVWL
jgi:SEC-C motif